MNCKVLVGTLLTLCEISCLWPFVTPESTRKSMVEIHLLARSSLVSFQESFMFPLHTINLSEIIVDSGYLNLLLFEIPVYSK